MIFNSLPIHGKHIGLLAVETKRRFKHWLRLGPLFSMRYPALNSSGVVLIPSDMYEGDPAIAREIYSGIFSFNGTTVETDGASPFEVVAQSERWLKSLHSFSWLRHLSASNTPLTQTNARALVADWITKTSQDSNTTGRAVDVTSERVIAWLTNALLLLENASADEQAALMKSLNKQVRFLRRAAVDARDGIPRLKAAIALAFASICMAGQSRLGKNAAASLDREIERQIFPDGGYLSRNPNDILEIAALLLPLKMAYQHQSIGPPRHLFSAIDRILLMLRFLTHSNGELARFNGTGTTDIELLEAVLEYDETGGVPSLNAAHCGYQRLEGGNSVVLFEAGTFVSDQVTQSAHAGTLSFELSSGKNLFVINCGSPGGNAFINGERFNDFARATAAHSTATLNDTSSSRFNVSGALVRYLGAPVLYGPDHVTVERSEGEKSEQIIASHDGYRNSFGMVHHRSLELADDGGWLHGLDRFIPNASNRMSTDSLKAAVRFHLHPHVKVSALTNGISILMKADDGAAWKFTCIDAKPVLEESIDFGDPAGLRKTQQIVLYIDAIEVPEIRWAFEKEIKKRSGKNSKTTTDQLPFDG